MNLDDLERNYWRQLYQCYDIESLRLELTKYHIGTPSVQHFFKEADIKAMKKVLVELLVDAVCGEKI